MFILVFSLVWLTVVSLAATAAWLEHWLSGSYCSAESSPQSAAEQVPDYPLRLPLGFAVH